MIKRIKNRLLSVMVAPYVKCSNCGALCEYGRDATKCPECSAKIVIVDDTPVQLLILQRGGKTSPYTAYARCPNCWRLLDAGTRLCPHCREELSERYAFFSSFMEVLKTMACNDARTIESFNPFAVILVVMSAYFLVYGFWMGGFGFTLTLPLLTATPLIAIALWYYRFGRIPDDDQDYLHARQQVKRALKLWVLMLAGQLFIVFLLFFPH